MTTLTSSSTSSTYTVRRNFVMVGGMGDQETQVERKVIASSPIMVGVGYQPGLREDHKERQFQSLRQVYQDRHQHC